LSDDQNYWIIRSGATIHVAWREFLMIGRRMIGVLALVVVLTMAGPAPAQIVSSADEEAAREVLQHLMRTDPEFAEVQFRLVKSQAALSVRIERLVATGVLCKLLSEDDARLIVANGRQDMNAGRVLLLEEQKDAFEIYWEGLRDGAQAASDHAPPEPAVCEAFSRPGGTLVKLLTWTDRPQFLDSGVRASPRTLP
jgi:hypothetical protein